MSDGDIAAIMMMLFVVLVFILIEVKFNAD